MGKGSNSTQQAQTSTTSVDPQAAAAYQQLIAQAQSTAQTPWNPNTAQQVAGFTQDQLDAFNNVRGGIAQPYINQSAQFATAGASPITAGAIQNYQNPWTDQVVNATQADFDRQNQRGISAVTGNARMAGSLGGDREQVAKALTAREQASVQSPIIANLRAQGYSSALGAAQNDAGRALQGSQALAGLAPLAYTDTQALLGIGGQQQGLQQQQFDASSGNAAAQSAYPFQTQQWLASILGSATPNMGSTTSSVGTKQGPQPNQVSQAVGAGLALLPYAAMLHTGGRVPYAAGGGIGYVPQAQLPGGGGGVRPAPMMQMGGDEKQKGFSDHFKEIQDTAKNAGQAFKGIDGAAGKVGDWMRTSTDPSVPNGWGTTTTTYADPAQNLGYGIQNTFGGMGDAISGAFSGFADGGAIDGTTALESGLPLLPPLTDEPTLMTQARAGINGQPFGGGGISAPSADLMPLEDIPNRPQVVGMPQGGGDAYAPPTITGSIGEANGINVTGGVGAGGLRPPAAAAEPAEKPGLWDRFNNWRQSDDGRAFLTNAGAAMMANSGVGGKGSFGIHAGQGLQAGIAGQGEYQKSQREQAIEKGKMALAERAALIREAEEGRAAALHPYERDYKAAQTKAMLAQAANKEDPTQVFKVREAMATKMGLKPGTDPFNMYVLNGKLPEEKQLTSTELKAIDDSVKAISAEDRVIRQLEKAKELSKNAASGIGAQTEAGMWAGLGLDGERSQNTLLLGNILSREAILDMSNTLKGASTDREMAEFQKLSGAATMSPAVRDQIIESALNEARTAKAVAQKRAEEIRGKAFFKPGGMTEVQTPSQSVSRPKDKAEFDRLPKGAKFIDPEGNVRVKP